MKPLKLTMQAFGPYAGMETIDFSVLGNRTMFVIFGKTGAGKTTIFDGISYAIYGKASGEDRNGPELRSQFAKNEVLTEVSLEFSLRQKRYSITRSPQQEKKKERGDGFTTIGAKAELYTFDEHGEKQLLGANVRDVDEKIKEIMLIDSNQFRQILMIPQGEFRKLLTSDSKDKEVILQRLFHTEIYKRVEEKLKEEATDLKKSVEKQIEERNQAIRGIHVLNKDDLKSLLEAESVNDTILLPLLQEEIALMSESLAGLTKEGKEKQLERDRLQQQLFEAETIVKQLKTRDELKTKKEELDAQKDVYERKEKEISLAHKAALLAQQEELCRRLKQDLDASKREQETILTKIEAYGNQLKAREAELEKEKARDGERKQMADQVNQLQNMKNDVYAYAGILAETGSLEEKLKETRQRKQMAENRFAGIAERIKLLLDEKQQIEKNQLTYLENERRIEKLADELGQMIKYEQQLSRFDEVSTVFSTSKIAYEKAEARLQDAKELVDDLDQKWLHGQAAILAGKLHNGDPCPVCGSEHHPNPAISSSEFIPNERDLKAAKQQAGVLEKEKRAAESVFYESRSIKKTTEQILNELFGEIANRRPQFTNDDIPSVKQELTTEKNSLEDEQKFLAEKKQKYQSIVAEVKNGENDQEMLQKSLEQLANLLNELTILFTEKKTALARMQETIPEGIRSIEAYESQLKQAVKLQEDLLKKLELAQLNHQETKEKHAMEKTRFETMEKHVFETEAKLTHERETFKQNLSGQGFETYNLYNHAKKTEAQIQQLEGETRQYREEYRSVSDRFIELSALLKDMKEPDMERMNKRLAEINAQFALIHDQYTNLFMKKRDNEEILAKIIRINREIKNLEERYKLIGHLYEISKGQNTYRITFERFVLAAFLDDILSEANVRLSKMTSGRYQLMRKTDRSKGNAQSGLELLVFDQYTGQERHVKTLSGGESFKAALSLALGLADVVQQYSGGVSLETMFIDEGFGTLDPESLDQAIEALIDIQSSGRLVGIISHVPELKERIDARLEVTATQSGSETNFYLIN